MINRTFVFYILMLVLIAVDVGHIDALYIIIINLIIFILITYLYMKLLNEVVKSYIGGTPS